MIDSDPTAAIYDLTGSRPLSGPECRQILGGCLIWSIVLPTLGLVILANIDNGNFQNVLHQAQHQLQPIFDFLHFIGQNLTTASENAKCFSGSIPIDKCR